MCFNRTRSRPVLQPPLLFVPDRIRIAAPLSVSRRPARSSPLSRAGGRGAVGRAAGPRSDWTAGLPLCLQLSLPLPLSSVSPMAGNLNCRHARTPPTLYLMQALFPL